MRLSVFGFLAAFAITACGGDGGSPAPLTPKAASFAATYGLFDGHVDGAPLTPTTTTGTAGFARLAYFADDATAAFSFAACVAKPCSGAGVTGYTAPMLRLASEVGRTLVFTAHAGMPQAVTVTASGVQRGVPFDLDARGYGERTFRITGTLYPFR